MKGQNQGLVALKVLDVPDRAKAMMPPPAVISKRSEKSRVSKDALVGADDGCMRSLPAVEMTAGEGRDDSGGWSR